VKKQTRSKVAAAAAGTALGIFVITYGFRTMGTLRALHVSTDAGNASAQPIQRNAFLVTTPNSGPAIVAQQAAYSLSDGRFMGRREYAYYGFVRVRAVVRHGKLSDVQVLEYPSDNGTSRYINGIALPYLVQEAVSAQSFRVDLISGATFTSVAFARSLREALLRAKI
jgi:uncharacterized protein with FMN-binding domain